MRGAHTRGWCTRILGGGWLGRCKIFILINLSKGDLNLKRRKEKWGEEDRERLPLPRVSDLPNLSVIIRWLSTRGSSVAGKLSRDPVLHSLVSYGVEMNRFPKVRWLDFFFYHCERGGQIRDDVVRGVSFPLEGVFSL